MTTISRDSFARQTLMRDFEWSPPTNGCTWCGEFLLTPAKINYLWKYTVEHDGGGFGPIAVLSGRFCSDDCLFSYHDLSEFQANYDKED